MTLKKILANAGGVLLLDQITKILVVQNFFLGESKPLFPFFSLTYVENTGTAFGLFQGNNGVLLILGLVILASLVYSARGLAQQGGRWGGWGVALVIGGAVGNLVDRTRHGRVIDFLDFKVWPVFNVADSAITLGAVAIAISLWKTRDQH